MRNLLTIVLAAACVTPSLAAPPRDELLRLVPDDVAFCLVVNDLRGHYSALAESPFVAQFAGSPVGKVIGNAPELAKLAEVEKFLKQHLGTDFAQLRDDILGDAVVLTYRPGPPGKPEQEQGLLLVRARNEKTLGGLIDKLNKAQQASGELKKLEERQHNGVKYQCRIERNQSPSYYLLRGPILVYSQQEEMLQKVIDLDRQAKPDIPVVVRELRQLGADNALLALWINPRAFDAELQHKAATTAQPGEAAFLKTFLSQWQAIEGIAFSLVQQQDLELNLAVRAKPEGLSPAARRFLAEAAKRSDLWNTIPKDALFATAGRYDVAALIELVGEFLDEASRKAIRESMDQNPVLSRPLRQLVSCLGPDMGMYLVAPPAGSKNWFPEGAWAVRLRPGADGKPVDQPLEAALNFFANLAVLDYNSKHEDRLTLKSVQHDKVEIKYFVNDKQFPPGLQPAFAVKDSYVVLATSPEVIRRFQVAAGTANEPAAEVPLVRWSLAGWRTYLKEHRTPLTAAIAQKNQITAEAAGAQLDKLLVGLQFIDTLELTQRPTPGQVILTLRIKPNQPLKK